MPKAPRARLSTPDLSEESFKLPFRKVFPSCLVPVWGLILTLKHRFLQTSYECGSSRAATKTSALQSLARIHLNKTWSSLRLRHKATVSHMREETYLICENRSDNRLLIATAKFLTPESLRLSTVIRFRNPAPNCCISGHNSLYNALLLLSPNSSKLFSQLTGNSL